MAAFLPWELVFNPRWWYNTAGVSFDEPFYLMVYGTPDDNLFAMFEVVRRYREYGA